MVTAAQILDAFVERMRADADAVLDETHRLMAVAVPSLDLGARPELAAVVEASSRAAFEVVTAAVRDGAVPTQLPPEAIAEARLCARLGIPVNDLLQSYRVAHRQTWDAAIDMVERAQAPASERAEALRSLARTLYGYLDLASEGLPAAYASAGPDREARLLDAVRRTLGGREELDGVAYDLRGEHVALVAWGGDVAELIRVHRADGALAVRVSDDTAWLWAKPDAARPEPPLPTRVALGTPARGPAGFRRSHAEAARAQAVAARTGAPVTRYADVALEWLALQDPAAARAFAERELGALLEPGVRARRLRETLAAYLAGGQSSAAAAAALGVADRTVAYRVRAAEQRLGAPVYQRATELAVALRWADLLSNLPKSASSGAS